MNGGGSVASVDTATVLVVDDEPDVADLYAAWLDDHEVTVAYDGSAALDAVDDHVDVVLLDRHMPGVTGDDVLAAIDNRGLDVRVVMVTAVDPDFDIVEMPFDDYLTKPVDRGELTGALEEMLARESYDERLREYFAMASKKASLETAKGRRELERSDAYLEVSERVEDLQREAARSVDDVEEPASLFRDFPGGE